MNLLEHLSMGMSEDYVSALENGATYIRVGSGILEKEINKLLILILD